MKNILLTTFSITIAVILIGSGNQQVFAGGFVPGGGDCTADEQCEQGKCAIYTCENLICTTTGFIPNCCASDADCPLDTQCADSFCNVATNLCELGPEVQCLPDSDPCTNDVTCDPTLGCNFFDPTLLNCRIAGELLPLNTSALMIAGLTSMSVWMVPAVAGLAGVGVYLVKFRANRN